MQNAQKKNAKELCGHLGGVEAQELRVVPKAQLLEQTAEAPIEWLEELHGGLES